MKIGKIIGIVILVIILATAASIGGLYLGWFPVPAPIVTSIAKAQGLNDAEAEQLTDIVNLYQVVKTAPEAPLLREGLALASRDASETDMKAYAVKTWPQISDATLLKVKTQLRIDDADFQTAKTILDARVAEAPTPDALRLTPSDIATFKALDAKYGFSALFKKFAKGTGKGTGAW